MWIFAGGYFVVQINMVNGEMLFELHGYFSCSPTSDNWVKLGVKLGAPAAPRFQLIDL